MQVFGNFKVSIVLVILINVNVLRSTPQVLNFENMFKSLGYSLLITEPTHHWNNRLSLIDNIWATNVTGISSGVFDIPVTDHYPIIVTIRIPFRNSKIKKTFRDHSGECVAKLLSEIGVCGHELSLFQGNFDDKVSFFHDLFYKYYDKCCLKPSKILSLQRFSKPWLTDVLMLSINHKHFLYRQYKPGYVEFEVYNLYKNRVTNLLRNAKSQHLI